MRSNLSYFEKVAGAFVGLSVFGMVAVFLAIGVRKGWFESKVQFYTELEDSEGLREGSPVQLAGVKIGEVTSIEMTERNTLNVKFAVLKRFRSRVRQGSKIQLIRPYVIGEKALYLTTPVDEKEELPALSLIPAEDVIGLTDLLNGRKFIPYVQTLAGVFDQLKALADLLLKNNDSKRMAKLVETLPQFISQVNRLTRELTGVASQVNEGENLKKVIRGLASATDALGKGMPEMAAVTPQLARDFAAVVSNLAVLTEEFKKVLPAVAEIAPELPRSSHRLVEALDEAVVVMKAMQKSFLLRGSAREVREEEAEREKAKRLPASGEKPEENKNGESSAPAH